MIYPPRWIVVTLSVCGLWAAPLAAQANQDPLLDTRLAGLGGFEAFGRLGSFPTGVNGVAFSTTVCNDGARDVEWFQAMDPRHPMIAFLVARVTDERIVQISDRSYVKHGFFAANSLGCGGPCNQPGLGQIGQYLGVGCSDTYGNTNNADGFWLGPADEIDPWLGTWDPVCSYFDRGEPDVGAPANCNGLRSLSHSMVSALGPVAHRVHLEDADLLAPGQLYGQAQYVLTGEPEAVRENNLGSRPFDAAWNGNDWDLTQTGGLLHGSVLQRWSGSVLASATNGADDGRVYVALKVSGPVDGFYHYEYALHNRDSARGVAALRLPVCPGARVRAFGFHDIDDDPLDDWSALLGAGELVIGNASAPLRWNTLYNVWFDCDAAPLTADAWLDAADPGPGPGSFPLSLPVPAGLANVYLGPGCAPLGPPTLFAEGNPPRAELGNTSFALVSGDNAPLQLNSLRIGFLPGTTQVLGCTLWMGGPLSASTTVSRVVSDVTGRAVHAAPIPLDPSLEGLEVRVQAIGRDPGHGVLLGDFVLSDGLLVRVGSALPGCR